MDTHKENAISILQTEGFIPAYLSSISDLSSFPVNKSYNQKTIKVMNFEVNSSSIPSELFPESLFFVVLVKINVEHDFNGSREEFCQYLESLWPAFAFRVFGGPVNSRSSSWVTIRIREPILFVIHGHGYTGKSTAARSLNTLKRIYGDDEIFSLRYTDSGKWEELREVALVGILEENISRAVHDIYAGSLFPDLISFLLRNVSSSENLILDLFMTVDMQKDFLEVTKKMHYRVYFVQNAEENYSTLRGLMNERSNLIASVAAISQQYDIAITELDRVLNLRIRKLMKLNKKLKDIFRNWGKSIFS